MRERCRGQYADGASARPSHVRRRAASTIQPHRWRAAPPETAGGGTCKAHGPANREAGAGEIQRARSSSLCPTDLSMGPSC